MCTVCRLSVCLGNWQRCHIMRLLPYLYNCIYRSSSTHLCIWQSTKLKNLMHVIWGQTMGGLELPHKCQGFAIRELVFVEWVFRWFGWLGPYHPIACCLAACTAVPVFSLRAANPRAVGGPPSGKPIPLCERERERGGFSLCFCFRSAWYARFLTFSIWLLCIRVLFFPLYAIMK